MAIKITGEHPWPCLCDSCMTMLHTLAELRHSQEVGHGWLYMPRNLNAKRSPSWPLLCSSASGDACVGLSLFFGGTPQNDWPPFGFLTVSFEKQPKKGSRKRRNHTHVHPAGLDPAQVVRRKELLRVTVVPWAVLVETVLVDPILVGR